MPESLVRAATHLLSPGGAHGTLQAFIFHRVLRARDPMRASEPTAEEFDRMLGWIGSQFTVLRPSEACRRLVDGSLPPRSAVITFDDGYRDNREIALPLLLRHRMPAVFFVASAYLNGGAMFNDRIIEAVREAKVDAIDCDWLGIGRLSLATASDKSGAVDALIARIKYMKAAERLSATKRVEEACASTAGVDLMMTDAQVLDLHRAGMEIGGHTRDHPILCALDDASAERQIVAGRDDLRAITGAAPGLFAYPNGKFGRDFDRRHCDMARRAGFEWAFTTNPGVSRCADAPYMLRRHTPWSRERWRFRVQSLRNLAVRGAPVG